MPNILDAVRSKLKNPPDIVDKVGVSVSKEKDGTPTIVSHKTAQIQTLEELLSEAKVDTKIWEVAKFKANVWHQMSSDNGLIPLWQVTAFLQARPYTQEQVSRIVREGLKLSKAALDWNFPEIKPKKSGYLVEFAIPDLHLGKLAWPEETLHAAWDCKTAEKAFKAAVVDLVSRIPEGTEEAVFTLGNDWFNVDNDTQSTTAGTLQDEDGRHQRTFRLGEELAFWAIALIRSKVPLVRVIVVPGNHDTLRAFYLGEVLRVSFKDEPSVIVDNSSAPRKYFNWGETLVGLTHGDRINKKNELAHLAQNEQRKLWGKTKRCEFHTGHLHQEALTEHGGVKIRVLPSLCPPEAWHSKRGYVLAERAATMFIYDKQGLQQIHYHYPKK